MQFTSNKPAVSAGLAQLYSRATLAQCLAQQIASGANHCQPQGSNEEILSLLAQAGVIAQLMEQGLDKIQALRELGRRMRVLQG